MKLKGGTIELPNAVIVGHHLHKDAFDAMDSIAPIQWVKFMRSLLVAFQYVACVVLLLVPNDAFCQIKEDEQSEYSAELELVKSKEIVDKLLLGEFRSFSSWYLNNRRELDQASRKLIEKKISILDEKISLVLDVRLRPVFDLLSKEQVSSLSSYAGLPARELPLLYREVSVETYLGSLKHGGFRVPAKQTLHHLSVKAGAELDRFLKLPHERKVQQMQIAEPRFHIEDAPIEHLNSKHCLLFRKSMTPGWCVLNNGCQYMSLQLLVGANGIEFTDAQI